MQASQIPDRYPLVWAKNAGGAYIRVVPVQSQIGIQDGAASFNDGFVPDNFTPVAAGGVPPFGQDFNGLLQVMTSWQQWHQAGGPVGYDATFATAVGGYPRGAILDSNVTLGAQWYSTVDGNLTNPDDPLTSVGWLRVGVPPGVMVPFFTAAPPVGWITSNTGTVGNAASGAVYNSDAYLFVFKAIWDQWSTNQCPIFTSGGAPTTRGANAVADFIAGKRLQTPDMRGAGIIGVDGMGVGTTSYLAGVPISIGNTTTPGSTLGANIHTLLAAEMPTHFHSAGIYDPGHSHTMTFGIRGYSTSGGAQAFSTPPGVDGSTSYNTAGAGTGIRLNSSNGLDYTNNAGGGGSHNNVQRSNTCYWGIKI